MDSRERRMNPVAMIIINPQKRMAEMGNQQPVLKSFALPPEGQGSAEKKRENAAYNYFLLF